MDAHEQINALHSELAAVLNRFRHEFEIPIAAAIGTLEIMKQQLVEEVLDDITAEQEGDTE